MLITQTTAQAMATTADASSIRQIINVQGWEYYKKNKGRLKVNVPVFGGTLTAILERKVRDMFTEMFGPEPISAREK